MVDEELARFGAALRLLRSERGYSQEEFAALIGIDRSYLGGVERGDRNPSLKLLFRICKALGLQPKELLK
ncbi:helix-turn-helix domain-containing protein [Mesorhizobium sp. B4-1-4]|uniref:helix-turn-helix domain-containing protein n=1 Tax=Mesorhizobium sp. B4-1-4 TaxID=2589888 RepID=UPI00112B8BFD|nr:helix-turn-helix transcriptional regulator [Mesorhizobium sp. B4-1-4]UCI30866.1 helix-turn-helix domain-containing protein [Mesorhizobium sp. B4-1-4]